MEDQMCQCFSVGLGVSFDGILQAFTQQLIFRCHLADFFLNVSDFVQHNRFNAHKSLPPSFLYEDTTPAYRNGWFEATSINNASIGYIYHNSDELATEEYYGYHDIYSGGGYVLPLNGSSSGLLEIFNQLEREHWFDDNTRAIFLDIVTYNAQANLFGVIRLVIESPPFGRVFPSVTIDVVRLINCDDKHGIYIMFFEVIYLIFVVVTVIKEVFFGVREKLVSYLSSFWKFIDLIICVMAVISGFNYLRRDFSIMEIIKKLDETNGNTYISIDQQRLYEHNYIKSVAFVVALVCMKIMNVFRFNRRIAVFSLTLSRSKTAMVIFGSLLVIVNMAFDMSLCVLLSPYMFSYRTMSNVVMTTIASLLGKLSAADVLRESTCGGIVYFIFMTIGTLFLLNVFVMMVLFEFEGARHDPKHQSNDYEAMEHIKAKALTAFNGFKRHHLPNLGFHHIYHSSSAIDRLEAKVELMFDRINKLLHYVNKKNNSINIGNKGEKRF
ncbi:unnamed protein product [Dracunculus medinensis]|uniref:PKD_channel domain-containing protein n=1 Tax=Dracunculus medinensis TaxID=318479 RepID=A0A0N4U9H8_DRAME|nr:unnamed protein product [Dracunculus medinensis]